MDGQYANPASERDEDDILTLIEQAQWLPGLDGKAGDFKGIHERKSKPHITVRFNVGQVTRGGELWPGHFSMALNKTTQGFEQQIRPKLLRGTGVGCLKPGPEPCNA